jgi:hypothetical protein
MSKKLGQMTPQQIRERGRELLRLAQQKEREVRQRQLVCLGEIFQREIQNGWTTPWPVLQKQLEDLLSEKIDPPVWGIKAEG